ncbi:MAG: hypothetical protein ACTSYO_08290 [Candidatus Ranarchaeia archaeon]
MYSSGQVVYTLRPLLNRIVQLALAEALQEEAGQWEWTIGSDEAGKGEVFGPLVICAVLVSEKQIANLRSLGVRDSKKISKNRILAIAKKIWSAVYASECVLITPERFTRLHKKFIGEGKTLNDLLAWGHAKAISKLLGKLAMLRPEYNRVKVIVDEFDKASTSRRLRHILPQEITLIQQPGAETFIPVAAASILAKAKYWAWLSNVIMGDGRPADTLGKKDIADLSEDDKKKLLKRTYSIKGI